jgi:hypothetical protein
MGFLLLTGPFYLYTRTNNETDKSGAAKLEHAAIANPEGGWIAGSGSAASWYHYT